LTNSPEKSSWADEMGPLCTEQAVADDLGLSVEEVSKLAQNRQIVSVPTEDNSLLFPTQQIVDGVIVPDVETIVNSLEGLVSDYMLASWMNRGHEALDNMSPWQTLRDNDGITPELSVALGSFASRMAQ